MKRKIVTLIVILALCLTACNNNSVDDQPSQETQQTPAPSVTAPEVQATPEPVPTTSGDPESEPEVPETAANPLTGVLMDKEHVNDRPIAIMLNNIKASLPQQGVAQADIIYEALAEGGITRMLAVYQNMDGVGKIGSVRSARTYYLELALGHDAVFLHAGGSPDSLTKVKEWNATSLDCLKGSYEGTLYWRDSGRLAMMSREHTVVTSGEKIQELFPKYTFRKEHADDYKYEVRYTENGAPVNGNNALEISVPFSTYKTGVFTYDHNLGKYLVEEYESPYVDGNTGDQVSVTNVLILKTKCSAIPGDTEGRISVDLSEGEGWFACGGKIIPIHWSKAGVNAPLVYTTQDGQLLTLGVGNSYVNIIPLENEIAVK